MISASLSATSAELRAEYAIIAAGGDEQHARSIQAKLDHLADLHWQIVGRPIKTNSSAGLCSRSE